MLNGTKLSQTIIKMVDMDTKASHISRLLMILDVCLTLFVYIVSFWLGVYYLGGDPDYLLAYLALSPLLWLSQSYFMSKFGAYKRLSVTSFVSFSLIIVKSIAISVFVFFTFLYALKIGFVSRGVLLMFVIMNFSILMAVRVLLVWWYFYRAKEKGENHQKVLIIGTGERAQRLSSSLEKHSEWGIDVIGYLDPKPEMVDSGVLSAPLLGSVNDVTEVLESRVVDEVILAIPRTMIANVQNIVDACEEQGVRFQLMADVFDMRVTNTQLSDIDGIPLLTFEPVSRSATDVVVKRLFDLSLTLLAMPLVLPVMAVVAIAVRLDSPGPILFVQQRVGYRKRLFPMYKFRSMYVDAEERLKEIEHLNEAEGPIFKMADDPRVTKVGKFIRRTSLDELPQLFNVLRGHMSLVGPRPMSIRDVDLFDRAIQRKRFSVKPGLTCIWQISGRSNLPFDKWLELDLEYIDNWSLELDLKILLKTIPAVLVSRGAV